ncbi:phosphatase PAP2 family protein [Entomospira culicis]|uniref:Phosphatase PAP2 family protein n=1 Tax=Entomospira culicis TaxID=2719989 RepID=A0A968GGK9_9SPIO|nr:phosphatase PAP2 family protein [Entomospira culicis]NIZ19930.1 phosphatase PAP2 family protein [Entomospira culicis]NIZ70113.1 phosphatase PAP2 family protein [Entomospira culicis]WDI38040.1 phosphatase PAP2 family protein [Entomospira culicis]WDI39663.1 phosphatase PAP2 family protein [Entomospira culicis]
MRIIDDIDWLVLTVFSQINPPAWLDKSFVILTNLLPALLVLFSLGLLFVPKYRFFAIASLVAGLSSLLLVEFLWKPSFTRLRPSQTYEWIRQAGHLAKGYSFPSGHSSFVFALTMPLTLIPKMRWMMIALSMAMITALSRLYLSAHFFSDVLVGMLHGGFLGYLTCLVMIKSKKIRALFLLN